MEAWGKSGAMERFLQPKKGENGGKRAHLALLFADGVDKVGFWLYNNYRNYV